MDSSVMSFGKAIKYSPVMCNDGWIGGQSVLLMRDELGTHYTGGCDRLGVNRI